MRILINGLEKTLPSSLREFTLGQRIDFDLEHGRILREFADNIAKMPEGFDKELALLDFTLEKIYRAFSFFTGIDLEVLRESDDDTRDQMANIYLASIAELLDDEAQLEEQREFEWQGEIWKLEMPEVKQGDGKKTGALLDSKQIVQDMHEVGAGRWEQLLPLCAIYLRRTDEAYSKEFLYEGSERLQLMRELPMDMALQVGFFLTNTMIFYCEHFRSFKKAESKAAASFQKSTTRGGAGLTSSNKSQVRSNSTSRAAT